MTEDFVALVFVKLLYDVDGVVGVEVFNLLGDVLGVHLAEELCALVFVELHEHVGLSLFVKESEEIFCFFKVEVAVELGDVGGVEVAELFAGCAVGVVLDDFAQVLEVFGIELFHW